MQGSAAARYIQPAPLLLQLGCWFCFSLIFCLIFNGHAWAFENGLPLAKNFKPKDYNAGTQNWALIQDHDGLIYVGNNVGVLEFDGVHWRTIATTNQSVVRSLALANDGRIYVGAKGDLGYIDKSQRQGATFVSWRDRIPPAYRNFQDIRQTFATEQGILFVARSYLFLINDHEVKSWSSTSAFMKAFQLNGQVFIKEQHTGLLQLKDQELVPVAHTESLANTSVFIAEQWQADQILLGSRDQGFFLLGPKGLTPWDMPAAAVLKSAMIYNSSMLSNGLLAVATVRDGVYLINQQGAIQGRINKDSGILDDNVRALFEDQQKGLWLALDHGLSRVEASSAISMFNHSMGLKGNVLSLYRHKQNLYAGTSLGLFRLEASGSSPAHFRQINSVNHQTWDFTEFGQQLLIANNKGVYQLEQDDARLVMPSNLATKVLQVSKQQPNKVWIGLQNGLSSMIWQNGQWQDQGMLAGIEGNLNSIVEVADGSLWIGTLAHGVYHVQVPDHNNAAAVPIIEHFNQASGLPSNNRNSVHHYNDGIIFATVRGLYQFNQSAQKFELHSGFRHLFHVEPWIRSPSVDNQGNIWMLTWDNQTGARQAGAAIRNYPDESYQWTAAPLYPLADTPLDVIFIENDNVIWFGGAEGIFRFDQQSVPRNDLASPPLIRKVTSRDKQRHFSGGPLSRIQLSAKQNSLRIEYTVPRYGHLDTKQFQAQLQGYDQGWSDWHNETYQDYTNLEPGQYQFLLRYKNAFGEISSAVPLHFEIAAPWYQQWWAYSSYVLICGFALAVLIRWRLKPVIQQNLQLEDLVAKRTRHLEETMQMLETAKSKAEAAAVAKSEFLANMSHEIRTPMNAIIGFSQLAQNSEAFAEQQLYLSKISASSKILLSIINDILDFSKVEAGKLELEQVRFRLQDMLQQTKDLFIEQARQKRLELQFNVDPSVPKWLIGDPLRLSQVLVNLLSNAVKFTGKGQVQLQVDRTTAQSIGPHAPAAEVWLKFSVQDSGIGLTQAQCNNLFQAFSQADNSTSRKYGGTGLGLSIAQRLVKLMGGQITVQSEPGVGSTFSFNMRCYLAEQAEAEPLISRDPPPAPKQLSAAERQAKRILLVEDNSYNQTLARIILQHAGFAVDVAGDGEHALLLIKEQQYQLVLMDVHMPKLDGYQATMAIRAQPQLSRMPVIALTAHVTEDFQSACYQSGMNDFITKPFDAKMLVSKVLEWV